MRHRNPPIQLSSAALQLDLEDPHGPLCDALADHREDTQIGRYHVTLITPLFGGGVTAGTPDLDRPIRATEILHGLRFWWRLGRLSQLQSLPPSERFKELFKEERALWGAAANQEQAWPCQVRVRVDLNRATMKEELCCDYSPEWKEGRNGKLGYWKWQSDFKQGPTYVLFPGKGKPPSTRPGPNAVPRWEGEEQSNAPLPLLLSGLQFQMTLEYLGTDPDQKSQVEKAMQAWACFGGVGARTRRGLGAVCVKEWTRPGKWELLKPLTPKEALDGYRCVLVEQKGAHYEKEKEAWETAVDALQGFLQGEDVGRRTRLGRSNWPEADTIRQEVKHWHPSHPPQAAIQGFPRAAFGLPREFRFTSRQGRNIVAEDSEEEKDFAPQHNPNGWKDPKSTILKPQGQDRDRLASPLILKPMACNDGRYAAIALLLPTDHLLDLSLQLDKASNKIEHYQRRVPHEFAPPRNRGGTFNNTPQTWWAGDWQQQCSDALTIQPLEPLARQGGAAPPYRDGDPSLLLPLAAFLEFFADPSAYQTSIKPKLSPQQQKAKTETNTNSKSQPFGDLKQKLSTPTLASQPPGDSQKAAPALRPSLSREEPVSPSSSPPAPNSPPPSEVCLLEVYKISGKTGLARKVPNGSEEIAIYASELQRLGINLEIGLRICGVLQKTVKGTKAVQLHLPDCLGGNG